MAWPPTEETLLMFVSEVMESCVVRNNWRKDFMVLCYLDRPNVLHFSPKYFAKTRYVRRAYTVDDRELELIVGEAYSVDDVVRVEDLSWVRYRYF